MAITVAPPRLPSMEQISSTVMACLQRDLPSALNYVMADPRFQDPEIHLNAPAVPEGYSEEVKNDYQAVPSWPFVVVFTGDVTNVNAYQSMPGGEYEGEITIREFIQDSDAQRLTRSLSRYMAALWLVLINADQNRELGGELVYGSEDFSPDPSGGTNNARACQVYSRVRFRV